MNPYVKLLLDVILDPVNVIIIVIYLSILARFKSSTVLRWNLLALVALTASFSEFRDFWISDPPPLVFPLQQLRAYGRPISVVLLFTFILINKLLPIQKKQFEDSFKISTSLIILQTIFFIKNFIYGSIGDAFVAFIIFIVVIYAFGSSVSTLLYSDQQFRQIAISIVLVVLIFNLLSMYQTLFDYYPLAFTQGRFFGLTGNPQHAAVIYASSTPFMIFLLIERKSLFHRSIVLFTALSSVYYLLQTGSRTGLLISALAILIFLFNFKRSAVKWVVVAGAIAYGLQNYDFSNSVNFEEKTLERYDLEHSTTSIRAQVFALQMRQFSQNPIFGIPLKGDRLRFSENSYGAVAYTVGIVGLIPLFFFIRGLFKLTKNLWQNKNLLPDKKHYYLAVISGIISLLIGAFLEAYLLGSLTWPLIILFIYVSLGYYLLNRPEENPENEVEYNDAI